MSLYYKILFTILIIGCSVAAVPLIGLNYDAKTYKEKKLHKMCIYISVVGVCITILCLIAAFIGFVWGWVLPRC